VRTMPSCGAYFAEDYVFHGPGGGLGFEEFRAYFASLRAAFAGLRLVGEQIIADGRFLAARNTFAGGFTGVFTSSPIGAVEPTGRHIEWEVINTFRYDQDGRLAQEWAQTGYRSFLAKLCVNRHGAPPSRTIRGRSARGHWPRRSGAPVTSGGRRRCRGSAPDPAGYPAPRASCSRASSRRCPGLSMVMGSSPRSQPRASSC